MARGDPELDASLLQNDSRMSDDDDLLDTVDNDGLAPGEAPRCLTTFNKLAFGVGESATAICGTVLGFYLNQFLLQVAKIQPSAVAAIFGVGRFWDAVTDPMAGRLTDKTQSRWGRRRPWLLYSAVPCGFAYFLLWQTYPDWSFAAKVTYYLLAYCFLNTMFTCYSVPYTCLGAELTDNIQERNELVQFRMSFSIAFTLVTALLQGYLVGTVYKDDERTGYFVGAVALGAFIAIPILLTFLGVRERPVRPDAVNTVGFFEGIKIAVKHKSYRLLVANYLFCWLAVQFTQNNLVLYLNISLDLKAYFTYMLGVVLVSTFIFVTIWVKVMKVRGKKSTFVYGMSTFVLINAAMTFMPRGQVAGTFVAAGFAGVGVSIGFVVPWAMLPDVIDEDELATGYRREGLFYGFFVFFQKLALGAALAMSNIALSVSGYDTDLKDEEQPESVRWTLRVLVGPCSTVLVLLSFIPLYYYPITMERRAEITKQLNARKISGSSTGVPLIETEPPKKDHDHDDEDQFHEHYGHSYERAGADDDTQF